MPQQPPSPDLAPQKILAHPELYTPDEVAELLRVSVTTLYGIMGRGELPYIHIGRLRRITPRSLQSYIDGLEGGRFL